jgi:PAS domain S-box-containing protein
MTRLEPSRDELLDVVEVALVADTDHAVIVAGPDGVISFWNPAAERMFGHTREEALGQTLDIIIPEGLRERHWDGYRRVMETGQTDYGGRTLAVPAVRRDGTRISVEFTVTLLRDQAGALRGIGAILRDVTEKWEEQRALNRRMVELEREVATLRATPESSAETPGLSDSPLAVLLGQVASTELGPGAGPALAWTCGLAAALVEMVSVVALRKEPDEPATAARGDRAAALRGRALELAGEDVAAYSEVLAILRRRGEPGHGPRLREALSRAADPPLEIAEIAAEVTRLAARAASETRGAVRGEAVTAAVLGEGVVRAAMSLVELNLAGTREDPRHARVRELGGAARDYLARTQQLDGRASARA